MRLETEIVSYLDTSGIELCNVECSRLLQIKEASSITDCLVYRVKCKELMP